MSMRHATAYIQDVIRAHDEFWVYKNGGFRRITLRDDDEITPIEVRVITETLFNTEDHFERVGVCYIVNGDTKNERWFTLVNDAAKVTAASFAEALAHEEASV